MPRVEEGWHVKVITRDDPPKSIDAVGIVMVKVSSAEPVAFSTW